MFGYRNKWDGYKNMELSLVDYNTTDHYSDCGIGMLEEEDIWSSEVLTKH